MKAYFILILLLAGISGFAQEVQPTPEAIIYKQAGKDTLKAYCFKPKAAGLRPAILLFHGGAWKLGDASWTFERAKQFAEEGVVAFAIDYRLANKGLSPVDGVEDACAAFAWVRAHASEFNIDIHRVAGYGVSAGGHLVACAATLPSVSQKPITWEQRPNAILLYCAALNMAHDPYFNTLMKGRANPGRYSPSGFITQKLVPSLVIEGEKDSITFAADAKAFHDTAVSKGAYSSVFIYPGVGHLLTRNLKVQYRDFEPEPAFVADAKKQEDSFLRSMGYYRN